MAECPAWMSYVDAIEDCALNPVLDGEIFFLVNSNEVSSATTWGSTSICFPYPECGYTCPDDQYIDDVDIENGVVYFNSNLPNPELGNWRYEFSGTFLPVPGFATIHDCFSIGIIDNEGVFSWECFITFPQSDRSSSFGIPCGEDCELVYYDYNIPYFAINGIVTVFYALNDIEYGPITIDATSNIIYEVSCY